MKTKLVTTLLAASAAAFCSGAQAETGKLLLTGGVSSIAGAAGGINDRYELSVGQQDMDTRGTGTALGLAGLHLKQTILGAKVKVAGDAILDSNNLMPQIAVGVQYKTLASTGLDATLTALGAKRSGVDVYVSATKLFLGSGLLVNGTLRATKANQNGLQAHLLPKPWPLKTTSYTKHLVKSPVSSR